MSRILLIITICAALAACQSVKPRQVEMPYNDVPESSDLPRISPCACVDYSTIINVS